MKLIRAFAIAILLTGFACAQIVNGKGTKETESQTSTISGTALTFFDALGTQTNNFEMVVTGGPATTAITIQGCMRGGTCTTLTTSTSTSNAILIANGGPYDKYVITSTWTGGTNPTLTFNRTGSVARLSGGPGASIVSNPTGGQTVTTAANDGLHIEQFPCASLAANSQQNAGCVAAFNTYVVNSVGTTQNNLRKALNVYYQGNGQQGADTFGVQVNSGILQDANTSLVAFTNRGLDVNASVDGSTSINITLYGVDSRPRLYNNARVPRMVYYHGQANSAVPAGATVDLLQGVAIGANIAGTVTSSTAFYDDADNFQYGGTLSGSIRGLLISDGTAAKSGICHGTYTAATPMVVTEHDCMLSGSGAPEGALTANIGSIFARQDGAAGSSLYAKGTGSGNTGWLALQPVITAALVTTAAASDNVTVTGMTASGHCELFPTNAAAATNIATTFVSTKTTNSITVTHTATGSMNYDVSCTPL